MSAEATGRGTLTMTPKEVAERLGISEWWVREQIRRGRVPHLRFGRHRIALLPEYVDAIIELVAVEPAGWRADGGAGGGSVRPGAGRVRLERACVRQADWRVRLRARRPDGAATDGALGAGAPASAARPGRSAVLTRQRESRCADGVIRSRVGPR